MFSSVFFCDNIILSDVTIKIFDPVRRYVLAWRGGSPDPAPRHRKGWDKIKKSAFCAGVDGEDKAAPPHSPVRYGNWTGKQTRKTDFDQATYAERMPRFRGLSPSACETNNPQDSSSGKWPHA